MIEFVITFVLVLTVYAAAADDGNEVKGSAPLAIGLAIAIGHLFAVSISKLNIQHQFDIECVMPCNYCLI